MSQERIALATRREEDRKQKEEVKIQDIIEKESKPVEREHEHKYVYCVLEQPNNYQYWDQLISVFSTEAKADKFIQSFNPVVHYKLRFVFE